jgi:hypothetical protein
MAAQSEADYRPYLALESQPNVIIVKESLPGSGIIAEWTDFVTIRFRLINCGRSPLRFHVVDESFDGNPVDPLDTTPSVLFPGRTIDTQFRVNIPPTKVASLNGKSGRARLEYQRIGEDDGRRYFYEREFSLDIPGHHLNFTKEDGN